MRRTISFLKLLVVMLCIGFLIHLSVRFLLDIDLFSDRIILSYLVNFVLAGIIYIIIQRTFKKHGSQAGFIFMAGSGLKFLVFFLLFYPSYQRDGTMQTTEFAAFFVPYAICLLLEVLYLSKQLNNQSYSNENSEN